MNSLHKHHTTAEMMLMLQNRPTLNKSVSGKTHMLQQLKSHRWREMKDSY